MDENFNFEFGFAPSLIIYAHLTLVRVFVIFFLYHQNTALKDLNNSNIVHTAQWVMGNGKAGGL